MRDEVGMRGTALRLLAAGAFVTALSFAPFPSLALPSWARAATRVPVAGDDIAGLLPDDLLACAEAKGLGELARHWVGSPLDRRITTSRAWTQFAKSPEHVQMLAGLGFLELASGWKPAELFGTVLGDELVAGLVVAAGEPGLVVVLQTSDAESAEHLVTVARNLALASQEKKIPVTPFEHQGVSGIAVDGRIWLAAIDRCVVGASSEALLKSALERALAPPLSRTAPKLLATLRATMQSGQPDPLLRVALDLPRTAATRPDGRLLPEKSDNLAAGMLFGDLLAALNGAEVVTAEVAAAGDDLTLRMRVPLRADLPAAATRSFGHPGAQAPLLALAPRETLLTLSLKRDWAQYWLDRGELCDPKTEKEFADFETNLALFFGGRSIPDDILPRLDEEILFVLARQTYPGVSEPPAVKYPAGALVWRAKSDGGKEGAAKLGREFAVGITSLVGLVNIDRAQKNQTPLLPFVEPFEEGMVYGGRFLTEDDRPADPGRYNFSPCATWVGDRIVLSSSEELLHDLVHDLKAVAASGAATAAAPGRSGWVPGGRLSYLRIEAPALVELLRDDREPLITNAILSDGKERAQAEREQDLFAEIVQAFSHASIECRLEPGSSRLEPGALTFEVALSLLPIASPVAPATPKAAAKPEGSP